jgi:hypothetical protein
MEVLMRTRPALRLLAPALVALVLLVALALLVVLLAARQAPIPTPTSIPSPPTSLGAPGYVFVPADLPPSTTTP